MRLVVLTWYAVNNMRIPFERAATDRNATGRTEGKSTVYNAHKVRLYRKMLRSEMFEDKKNSVVFGFQLNQLKIISKRFYFVDLKGCFNLKIARKIGHTTGENKKASI